eukprot:614882-Pelagomonas_calceolata.AAC.2
MRNDPIWNARHAVMPGIGKCENPPLDKKQIAKGPHKPAIDITALTPCQSNLNLQLKELGSPRPTQTAAARSRTAR